MMRTFGPAAFRRMERFFTEPFHPRAGFQLSPNGLIGLVLAPKEKAVSAHLAATLPAGAVDPSFDNPNIPAPGALEDKIRDAARRLGLSGGDIVLLPPEGCFKSTALLFDEFPAAAGERAQLLSHRLNKIMPLRPADARISYDAVMDGAKARVFLSLARASVVEEYERLFARVDLRVRTVCPPSLGLLRCVPDDPGKTVLVAAVEDDSIALLAASSAGILLYRFKPFLQETSPEAKLIQAATEIQNTLHFLEDHEGRKADGIFIRCLFAAGGGDGASFLRERLPLPVQTVACPLSLSAAAADKPAYAPLMGFLS